ncbi:hypothetical protein VM1G_11683 [Cytospora mali]|uniref:Uncharacterized protein n=2 Tax=Cytospora mali TaxID=578113 RepID=A0A194VDD5_CYTMA|nr:hypothetical protein VP1G_11383 [Valsa mali var. pyri (nom. inval.)]KUI70084.1 hypothetical protein VM1G_11683 [Valsa mali]
MLDTLLVIILQSWGLWPPRGVGPDRPREDRGMVRMTDEEAAEILRVLNSFSGRVETPDPQN